MKKSYRILKLRSGEELIAGIRGESNNKLILERPMIFKSIIIPDPFGKQKEITILKNWLSNTNEIQTKIPKDFIATFLTPDSDVVELYDLEKEKQDVNANPPRKIYDTNKRQEKRLDNMSDEDIKHLLDMIKKDIEENPNLLNDIEENGYEQMMPPIDGMMPPNMKNFINMSLFLPPEALMSLVEGGILDVEDVHDLIDALREDTRQSNHYTGNNEKRKKSKDFGNIWTDWSSDLEDYME